MLVVHFAGIHMFVDDVKLRLSVKYAVDSSDTTFNLLQNFMGGKISEVGLAVSLWKNLQEKLTYLHSAKGAEMVPTLGEQGGTLLVRKIPAADTM